MKVKNFLFFCVGVFGLGSCSPPQDEIPVTLSFADSITSEMRGSIQSFIFIVKKASQMDQTSGVIYPKECVDEEKSCLKDSSCGFSLSDETFQPMLQYSQFSKGEEVVIFACAMGEGQQVVAEGQSSEIKNQTQSTVDIFLTLPKEVCAGLLNKWCS